MRNSQFPLVSVVLPTINRPSLIRAIESVLNQTYSPLELIVIGDGCRPKITRELSEQFDEIQIIEYPKSGRPAPLRNHGLITSKGDFVAFLDDDDEWDPHKIQHQMNTLQLNNYLAVSTNAEILTPYRRDLYFERTPSTSFSRSLFVNPVILSSLMIDKSRLADGVRFPEDLKYRGFEDHLFVLHLQLQEPVLFLDEPLVIYNLSSDQRLSDELQHSAWRVRQSTIFWLLKTLVQQKPRHWLVKFIHGSGLLLTAVWVRFLPRSAILVLKNRLS